MLPADRINLTFFCYPKRFSMEQFTEVARRVRARYPHIVASARSTKRWIPTALAILAQTTRPTLSIELDRVRIVKPFRGHRLRQLEISKLDELRRLEAAEVPIPRWVEIVPGLKLDPAEWGPYVITKPTIGGRGAYVRVRKTSSVRHRLPEEFEEGHLGRDAPLIAQEFIFTGAMPVSYRVVTFMGRPVLAIRHEGRLQRPLAGRFDFKATGGHNIVATAKGAKISLVFDSAILDLARKVHSAFPEVPVLGTDIIEDAETGRRYALECNPSGAVWLLSSGSGRRIQAEFGLDFLAQFNALDVVAEASAEAAERLAR